MIWDTGTGKTGFIASALLWHGSEGHPYDLALVVVKKNNKRDTQRKLKKLAGIDSLIIQGTPDQRAKVYEIAETALERGEPTVIIANYEQFRLDDDVFKMLFEDRDVLIFWDEMPTRLSNRATAVYKAAKDCIWKTFSARKGGTPRPKWIRQWELTATPIENSPEGLFNCLRLMNPTLLGLVEEFHSEYVSYRNPISFKPERWTHLDKLEGRIEHMTHRVSQADPEVAKMFPDIMPLDPVVLIDWDSRDRAVYDKLLGKASDMIEEADMFEDDNILSLIQILQMMCDAPSMIQHSAANREEWERLIEDDPELSPKGSDIAIRLLEVLSKAPVDDFHTKFDTLRELLTEKHPNDKALVYMTWAGYGYEPLEKKFEEWGITYAAYTGTDNERQRAKDEFRQLGGPQVFLSSDKGSDSIDLPEAAVGINYNLPWTWTRYRQRQGRNNRVDSRLETTWWYDLIMANSVEERKQEIITTKRGYHEALFDKNAIDDSISSKLTREDLLFILGIT